MHTRQEECFCIVCPHHYLAAKQTGEHITHYILALRFVEENVKRKCDYFQFKLKFSIFGAIIPFKSGEDVLFPILARLV